MNAAPVGIAAAVALALGLGFLAGRGRQMNLEQWTVAGRAFGRATGVSPHGGGNLHDLHLFGR
jgi:Na+/proline symporter